MELGPILRRLAVDSGVTLMPRELPQHSGAVFKAGSHIALHAPAPRFLANGWVLASRTLPDGRRQEMQLFMPGDHLTDFGEGGAPWQTLTALVNSSVISFSVAGERDARFEALLRRTQLAAERRLFDHLLRLGRMDALERTAHFLRDVYTRWGETHPDGAGTAPLPLVQVQMSDYLAISAVHMNRTLQILRRAEAVDLHKGLTVDLEKLKPFLSFRAGAPLQTAR